MNSSAPSIETYYALDCPLDKKNGGDVLGAVCSIEAAGHARVLGLTGGPPFPKERRAGKHYNKTCSLIIPTNPVLNLILIASPQPNSR